MSRSDELTHSLLAISAGTCETGLNVFQNADTSFLIEKSQIVDIEERKEENSDEATGEQGPTKIYHKGKTAKMSWPFNKGQTQHLCSILGYGLGSVVSVVSGAGYKHTITKRAQRLNPDRSHPSFTVVGRDANMEKVRYASGIVNSGSLSFPTDDFMKVTGEILMTGKMESSQKKILVSEAADATSLTLTDTETVPNDYGVQGATAEARLANIDYIMAQLSTGEWVPVTFSAVDAATPAVLTITAPDTDPGDITYEVNFIPTEAAWCTFPSLVTESPLYVTDLTVNARGKYAAGVITGGMDISKGINSFEYQFNNNGSMQFKSGGDAAASSRPNYANFYRSTKLDQKILIDRDYANFLLKQLNYDEEVFAMQYTAIGAEFAAGEPYKLVGTHPRCQILNYKKKANSDLLGESVEITILHGHADGSSIFEVYNQVAAYAA